LVEIIGIAGCENITCRVVGKQGGIMSLKGCGELLYFIIDSPNPSNLVSLYLCMYSYRDVCRDIDRYYML
jgi:hypothetical protein